MSFSDQKDSNISISGSSDPIRNVANSFAARPRRVGSAARYQDGKGDSSPEHVRTPQADDPDEVLPDYVDDASPPNNPFAGISNLPHQAEVKELKDRESKHQPPPHDALHASVSAYLASLSTAPPPTPATPYRKYGQSNELKLPSRFQECSICFQKSYSKSTGANCSTCVYIICRSCFIQIGSSNICPQCRTPTVSSAEILTPSINVDENALETMRVENINILAQLQAQGINPWIINITNMKRHIKNHQAALYEVLQYSIENPYYHLNDQKIKEAEYALEEVKKDVLPKIALIQQYIENEQAMEKARKIIDAADRVHKRITKKTDGRIKAEARLRQGFDYSAYTASLVRPPSSNKPSVRQPSGPLVNGNGWIDGLYVGDGQS